MISVLNRLQLLSGNNYMILLLMVFSINFTSCTLFTKVPDGNAQNNQNRNKDTDELDPLTGRRVYDPQTGTYIEPEEVPKEVLDTIFWKEVEAAVITSEDVGSSSGNLIEKIGTNQFGSDLLSSYNVTVMLPFVTNRFNPDLNRIDPISDWALHYYGGSQIAFEELSAEGIKLNVSVLDTKGNPREVSRLIRENDEIQNAHLIIGPYREETVGMVSQFANRNDITFVSPHFVPKNDALRNPNYIQVKPSLRSHMQALVKHARKYFTTDQIVLVSQNNGEELQAMQYLQEENQILGGVMDTTSFREYILNIPKDGSGFNEIDVLPFVTLSDTTVFIVPSWSNEQFVFSFLRKVEISKAKENYVVIYGMPQWTRFERIDFEYFDKLNVHVSSSMYYNPVSEDIQRFKRTFYEKYGVIPNDEAYLGRDVTLYFGRMINQYGTKFQYFIENNTPENYLHTYFNFQEVVIPTTTGAENLPIEKFENKYLHILKFKDFQFQPTY